MPKISKRTGKIAQITQIVHNDIIAKEIKSAHDHFRCKITTNTSSTFFKNDVSKCYGHMGDHVIKEGRRTHRVLSLT